MTHRLAVALGAAFYGGITVGGRYFAGHGFSLLEISLNGTLFASVLLAPWVLLRRDLRPRREDLDVYLGFGLVGAALQLTQFGGIVAGVPVAVVALLLYSQPVWTVVLGRVLLAEPVTPAKIAAGGLALAGTVVLLDPWNLSPRSLPVWGLVSALAAGLMLSLWVVLARVAALRRSPPLTVSFGYSAATASALLLLAPLLAVVFPEPEMSRLQPSVWVVHWPAVGLYTLGANIAPALLVLWGMREVDASTAGVLLLLEPVAAALLAAWAFSEGLTGNVLVGGALVLASNAMLVRAHAPPGEMSR